MSNTAVAHRPTLAKTLGRYGSRIRRLEINARETQPTTGLAQYEATYTLSATATWTPDFSSAVNQFDSIGCTPEPGGLSIPSGWMWWATAFLVASAATVVAGDFLLYGLDYTLSGTNYAAQQATPIRTDGAPQAFSAFASGGTYTALTVVGIAAAVKSMFGTEFVPASIAILVTGIEIPLIQGAPGGGS